MVARPANCKPALGHDWLLPLYDPLHRWLLRESTLKSLLLRQAAIAPGQRLLDLACGTGTLALMLQQHQPRSQVHGLDGDPLALRRAQAKGGRRGSTPLHLQLGLSYALPYPDRSFDHVFSSFAFHHLSRPDKRRTLAQIRRVLKPGGAFHLLDLGPPTTALGLYLSRLLHPDRASRDNLQGLLSSFMADAGLAQVRPIRRRFTAIGWVAYYQGCIAVARHSAQPLPPGASILSRS
ncbi:MAG: methyltransferase domain-containing protein [Candidatus Latescibacteria bacterium]|nr:methyltransferase domain-containing protein [Candidatus Latescibacterota bacterium]